MSLGPIFVKQLPFLFDVARMQVDLAVFAEEDWQPHYNQSVYEGKWSGISLRQIEHAANPLFPNALSMQPYVDSAAMQRTQYFPEILASLQCETRSVRLLKLAAGSSIRKHRDYRLSIADGEVRLHAPIVTDPQVQFYSRDQLVPMRAGELWFVDFSEEHHVTNQSEIDRVHLVIDCMVNDWLMALLVEP